jgi:tetratricopeptide (TPR) repeat protein
MTSGFSAPQLELALATSHDTGSGAGSSDSCIDPSLDANLAEERRYRRILARKERQGDLAAMAACYIRLGDLLLSRGDSEEAGEHYRRALNLSRAAHENRQALARS